MRLGLLSVVIASARAGAACGTSGPKVALIGDSITGLSRERLSAGLGDEYTVEVMGKFGARSDEIIAEVKVIAASHPSAAVINIGTNDALQRVPAEQTKASVQEILDLLDDVGCRYLVEINNGITDLLTGDSRADEARAINAELDALARENPGVKVVEWNAAIAEHGGVSAVMYDTVHLSEKGQSLLAETYQEALSNC